MGPILHEYRLDVVAIYSALRLDRQALQASDAMEEHARLCESLRADFAETGQGKTDEDGNLVMPPSPEAKLRARLAQAIGAASKRALRRYVCDALILARREGLDVTPSIAQHVCHQVVGRGVKREFLNDTFGTKGRTAADKSMLTDSELRGYVQGLQAELDELKVKMHEIRVEARMA